VTGPTGPAGAVSGGGITFDEVAAGQGTNSPAFTDLETPGPSVTVTVPESGRVLVTLSAELFVRNVGGAIMSFASTGGSGDVDPDESRSIFSFFSYFDPDFDLELVFDMGVSASATIPLAGLSPGSHTFTAKYQSLTGDFVSFRYRRLIVTPLP
jgi:hypothetical protein